MTKEDQSNSTLRRTFMKGAAATGVAATGVTAFSGGAAAQPNVRNLNVRDIQQGGGLLSIQVQNVNVLRDFDEIVVTVIGGDVREILVFEDTVINIEDRLINIEDIDIDINIEDVLNDNVTQVVVSVLSDGDVVATGDLIDN